MKIKQTIYVFLLLLCTTVVYGQEEGEGEVEFETQTEQVLELENERQGNNRIFRVVEVMPQFPGCEAEATPEAQKKCADMAMIKYVYSNMKYPAVARKNGTEGTAIIEFIVEADGQLTNFEIRQDPGDGCGAEALRVFLSMPNWIPGKLRGEGVAVKMNFPVKFRLENGSKRKKKKRKYN